MAARFSFTPVNALQDGLTETKADQMAKDSVDISASASPKLSPDEDSDVLEDIPSKSPMGDMYGDVTDPEDMITIYTGKS